MSLLTLHPLFADALPVIVQKRLDAALHDALGATAQPRARSRLLRQWLVYFAAAFAPSTSDDIHDDRIPRARLPGTMLVEKTPENFLLAPMLHGLEGGSCSSLLVTVRHPLVWALVVGKWLGPHTTAGLGARGG